MERGAREGGKGGFEGEEMNAEKRERKGERGCRRAKIEEGVGEKEEGRKT